MAPEGRRITVATPPPLKFPVDGYCENDSPPMATLISEHAVEGELIFWRAASARKAPIEDWVTGCHDSSKSRRLRGQFFWLDEDRRP